MIFITNNPEPSSIFDYWKIAELLVPLFIAFIAAFLAYKYSTKQLKKSHELTLKQMQSQHELILKQFKDETPLIIEREKYNKVLDSLQECWKLLVFMTDTENDKAIITWVQAPDKSKIYYGSISNAKAFLEDLPKFFYTKGSGLYIPSDIKALLFEYRGILYGLLQATNDNNIGNNIELKNELMVKHMFDIHKELIKLLHEKMELKISDKL